MKLESLKLSLVTVACAAAVVGCGGGGGGGTTSNNASSPTPPVVGGGAANYVTAVPAANYTSESAAAYALLNAERQNCGFGLLAQNASLDTASKSHANYMLLNLSTGHAETSGQAGFTGASVNDRVVTAGYGSNLAGEVAWTPTISPGIGQRAVRTFLNGPYHAAVALSGFRDVGVSIRSSADLPNAPGNMGAVVIDFGYMASQGGMQDMAAGDVRTYPCANTAGIAPRFGSESPNPLPGRDLGTRPAGAPLMVFGRQNTTVAITAAVLINVATGASIPMLPPVSSNTDPNSGILKNVAYVFPDVALDSNTQYQATINGTSNGVAFGRTFTFTTGTN